LNPRNEILESFGPAVFSRPLFYCYPGGLRFELSEGGTAVRQLVVAMEKARRICKDIFDDGESMIACVRAHADSQRFSHRRELRALRDAGIRIPARRWIWSEEKDEDDRCDDEGPEYWVHLAFEAPAAWLESLLWCALAKDLGIHPQIQSGIYLFNLKKNIVAFPYDDRGMDVVGPNEDALRELYEVHGELLLEYDREIMEGTFGVGAGER